MHLRSIAEPKRSIPVLFAGAILAVFDKIFAALAAKGNQPDQLMIDAIPKAKVLLIDKG